MLDRKKMFALKKIILYLSLLSLTVGVIGFLISVLLILNDEFSNEPNETYIIFLIFSVAAGIFGASVTSLFYVLKILGRI
jgi:ABC-type multidrug transport system permease subunit